MTLKIFPSMSRGFRVVKAVCVINKSAASGIPAKRQKTFTIRTVAPQVAVEDLEKSFQAEANRWQARVMAKFAEQQQTQPERNENS